MFINDIDETFIEIIPGTLNVWYQLNLLPVKLSKVMNKTLLTKLRHALPYNYPMFGFR